MLSLILGIRDLNEGNIGIDKEERLKMIDFYVPDTESFLRRKILDDFKSRSNFGRVGEAGEMLAKIISEERVKIARNALPHWKRINDITSEIIGCEKNELRKHDITFQTKTNDVDQYVDDIKANYSSMCTAFQ